MGLKMLLIKYFLPACATLPILAEMDHSEDLITILWFREEATYRLD